MMTFSKSKNDELISLLPSKEAEEELINTNVMLVKYVISKYFRCESYEGYEDLLSCGTIGLVKAIRSFDVENGAMFSTYAAKCIKNEIRVFLRREKKHKKSISLEEVIEMKIQLRSWHNTEEEVLNGMMIDELYKAIEKLDAIDRNIIELSFGLNGNLRMRQKDIARKFGISQSYVSIRISRAIKRLEDILMP